jgi:hypothetical protein
MHVRPSIVAGGVIGGSESNIPLEVSFYLSSYISALQKRGACDTPTISEF